MRVGDFMEDTRTRISSPSEVIRYDDIQLQDIQEFSRYRTLRRLTNENSNSFIESPNRIVIRESTKDSFYKVDPGFENRLDLISNMFYGTPKLWWALAYANKLYDPRKVKSGIILRIPYRNNIAGIK